MLDEVGVMAGVSTASRTWLEIALDDAHGLIGFRQGASSTASVQRSPIVGSSQIERIIHPILSHSRVRCHVSPQSKLHLHRQFTSSFTSSILHDAVFGDSRRIKRGASRAARWVTCCLSTPREISTRLHRQSFNILSLSGRVDINHIVP